MPTYEYECNRCSHRFEKFQSMTDDPIKVCPVCSGEVRRLIGTGAGIIFKGSGFYCTDYKRSAQSNPNADNSKKNNECKKCCGTDKPSDCPKS